jgi:Asp-tRNA(Asn)/Glu-tRNA(Gln) amidotransferase A subunit family amidase
MKDSSGMPIGVQVTALPFRDEIALHAMQEIEFSLGRPFQTSRLAKNLAK